MAHPIHQHANLSDEQLFVHLGEGDRASFVELYGRYRSRIYAYALRMLGDRDRAGDVFQETFIRIYNICFAQGREITNPASYIFRTARNLCLNTIRDAKPTVDVEDFHQVDFQPSHENVELAELVRRSLDLLPQHHREAFVLREYNGLSYQEISEVTGTSLAAVKVHIFRAKEKLRKILTPYFEEA